MKQHYQLNLYGGNNDGKNKECVELHFRCSAYQVNCVFSSIAFAAPCSNITAGVLYLVNRYGMNRINAFDVKTDNYKFFVELKKKCVPVAM